MKFPILQTFFLYVVLSTTALWSAITLSPTTLPNGATGAFYSQTITASGEIPPYSFSIAAGSLPSGLSLTTTGPDTALISGTPTALGTSNFVLFVNDSAESSIVQPYSITITCGPITFNTSSLPPSTVGVFYSQTISVSGGTQPYTFGIDGELPPGLFLNSMTGMISGTPTEAGLFSFEISVTDANGCQSFMTYTLAANCPAVTINTTTLPNGTTGTAYSQTISASGGRAPYTFNVEMGTLPQGLVLNPLTGVISGTPAAAGVYTFTISATDFDGCQAFQNYTVIINCPSISINTTSLPDGTTGTPYSQTISVSGGTPPYLFSEESGTLPPGLLLNDLTGEISGTPTVAGIYTFEISVTDADGCQAFEIYTLAINCPDITINTTTLPNGATGTPYSQQIVVSGGTQPYTFAEVSGTLPPGLSLNDLTGIISGTPTAAGIYNFEISVTDADGCQAFRAYTLIVNCPSLTINTESLPNGTTGVPYSQTISVSGGTPPYTFAEVSGSLPPGLLLNDLTGNISGTPTVPGIYTIEISVTDVNGCQAFAIYTISVNCPNILIETTSLPDGTAGIPYNATISVVGGTLPYTFSVANGTLPPGLFLNPLTGSISGTPTDPGIYSFNIAVEDADGCQAFMNYTVNIDCPDIIIAPSSLPEGQTGVPYSQTVTASGGVPPYTYSIAGGSLPPGLFLDATTGEISGTPTARGSFSFNIGVTDAVGCQAFMPYIISINCPTITITPSTLSAGTFGTPYIQTLSASGGAAPYTFSVTNGTLPPGLILTNNSPSTALITGIPTEAGIFTFEISVTDRNGCVARIAYAIIINCPLATLGPLSPVNGLVGVPFSSGTSLTVSRGVASAYNFIISEGSLPPGLVLSGSGTRTALISGTPTASGTYAFTITATDFNSCDSDCCAITLNASITICPVITFSPLSCPEGRVGKHFNRSIGANGGIGAFNFEVTNGMLPPGLILNPISGVISGIPTQKGTFNFTITGTDASGCASSQTFSIRIKKNERCASKKKWLKDGGLG
ncbi:MAG: putative Ig domain-containing protein [Candidatus Protochlamydia sp.]|nr:putative Ig domain-containing protein [Candidatus Protochlamydia sp.]